MTTARRDRRLQRYWDAQAAGYDEQIAVAERLLFGDSRSWVCSRATGDTLEVAVGTGLNLPHYPAGVRLTGLEWSAAMLGVARRRAAALDLPVTLEQGDARRLPYAAAAFDTVTCTFALCTVPDDLDVLREMVRVLRPGGRLLLADHVAASAWPLRVVQALVEVVSVPCTGEHWRRRPALRLPGLGLLVEESVRRKAGVVELVAARKP